MVKGGKQSLRGCQEVSYECSCSSFSEARRDALNLSSCVVLVVECDNVQRPVYYVSEVLHGPKERYPQVQKLLYALLMSSRKPRHYFQAHKIAVPSEFPLGAILQNRETAGRMVKWPVELGEFDFHFVSRTAIKSQILADFVAEWTNPEPVQDPQYDSHDQ